MATYESAQVPVAPLISWEYYCSHNAAPPRLMMMTHDPQTRNLVSERMDNRWMQDWGFRSGRIFSYAVLYSSDR